LIYDTETGLLLYGQSEILFTNLYKIELELNSTTLIEVTTNTSPVNTAGFETLVLVLGLISVKLVKKRSNKNKN
jgi:hypothetical protein